MSFSWSIKITAASRYGGTLQSSVVEPEILVARAVIDAVDHDRKPLQLRLPADRAARIDEDWPGVVLDQFLLDLPHQLFALRRIGFQRLLIDQFVDRGIAIAGIVARRAAD